VRTLVAACDLVRAPHLGEDSDIDMFDVSARDSERDHIL
jgi:hypothetical protein